MAPRRVAPRSGPNYRETAAFLTVVTGAGDEVRRHRARQAHLPEPQHADVRSRPAHGRRLGQIYASVGEIEPDGRVGAAALLEALVLLIWLGAVVMALGGALLPRRPALAHRRPVRAPRAGRRRAGAGGVTGMAARALRRAALALAGLVAPAAGACAVQPDEVLTDPALEARARAHLRGAALPRLPEPVHRRQRRAARARPPPASCASSSRPARATATIARFLVDRYGEFVLLRPSFDAHTLLLWLGPALVLLAGGAVVWAKCAAEAGRRLPR